MNEVFDTAVEEAIEDLTALVGVKAACSAVGRTRAAHNPRHRPSSPPRRGHPGRCRGHTYYNAKIAQGKTAREVRRCLKRRLADHIWRSPWLFGGTAEPLHPGSFPHADLSRLCSASSNPQRRSDLGQHRHHRYRRRDDSAPTIGIVRRTTVANVPAITHVALTATDLDRSAVWYERLAGRCASGEVMGLRGPTGRAPVVCSRVRRIARCSGSRAAAESGRGSRCRRGSAGPRVPPGRAIRRPERARRIPLCRKRRPRSGWPGSARAGRPPGCRPAGPSGAGTRTPGRAR